LCYRYTIPQNITQKNQWLNCKTGQSRAAGSCKSPPIGVRGSTSSVPALASGQSRPFLPVPVRKPTSSHAWETVTFNRWFRPDWGACRRAHEAMLRRDNGRLGERHRTRSASDNDSSSQTIFSMAESSRAKNTLISTSFWRDGNVSPILFPKCDAITPAFVTKARERFQIAHAAKSIRT
jgi:hypothetical protein